MTLKKLMFLGSVIGGAAMLRDKARRDRLFGWLQSARDRLDAWQATKPDVEPVLPPIRDYGPPYTPTTEPH